MSLADILAQPLTAFAFCWRLERRDGITLGLTSHDRALRVAGLDFLPAPGITPSAILRGGDPGADLMDVSGALSAAALCDADLDAGRWDGAAAMLHLTEWTSPGALWLELAHGTLGSVVRTGQRYSVALRGLADLLSRPAAPATSPTCRARLGNRACGVALRPLEAVRPLVSIDGETATFAGLVEGLYPFGRLRWLTGAATGLVQTIVAQDGDSLLLDEPPLPALVPGALALLTQGCDKRLATCAGRFANAVNFRGEPFLPGLDLLTRYPGA